MEDHKKNTSYASPKSGEEVERELEAYINEPKNGKRRRISLSGAVRAIRGQSLKKKRIEAVLAVAAAVCLAVRCTAGGSTLSQVPSMALAKGDVVSSLSLTGPVSGTDSADVVSNLHSEVLEIRVKEGDTVEKGQVLAVIDRTDAKKEVDVAQNAYDLAVSEYNESLRDTKIGYEKAKQDYSTASLNYERNKTLFEAGAISSSEFEAVGNALSDARRAVEGYRMENGQAVPDESYELKVKAAQFELDQKKRDLEDTEVKSPISGTVVRVNSKVGQFADKPEDEKAHVYHRKSCPAGDGAANQRVFGGGCVSRPSRGYYGRYFKWENGDRNHYRDFPYRGGENRKCLHRTGGAGHCVH